MKKKILILAIFISTLAHAISVSDTREHIHFLASDSLKGRKPGTPEGKIAAQYILDQINSENVTLLENNGFQYFDVVTSVELGDGNHLTVGDSIAQISTDYTPLSFTENIQLAAPITFVGYGIKVETDSLAWNDYENFDLKNRWAIILMGLPDTLDSNESLSNYHSLRYKAFMAKQNGADGVIFVAPPEFDKRDNLASLFFDKSESNAGLPVVQITRNFADKLLIDKNKTIAELELEIKANPKPASFSIEKIVNAQTNVLLEKQQTQNVVALLKGNGSSDKTIVLGAHYDHLGFGGPGSGSRKPDTTAIHPGADDNGSGVASIIEIFQKLAINENPLDCDVLFIAFGAEEMGVIGSKYFTENPTIPLENMKAMINIDMIGRVDRDDPVVKILGTGTATEFDEILDKLAINRNFSIQKSPNGFGPSDHSSFYVQNVPVLMFFTNAHQDYHTPLDTPDRVNYDGVADVANFVYETILQIGKNNTQITFQEAGPKYQKSARRGLSVTLGIMPDHISDVEGLRVEGVIKGRPADIGGMQKGDVIQALDGKKITNIYDYMYQLKEFSSGQRITVEVLRDDKTEILVLDL